MPRPHKEFHNRGTDSPYPENYVSASVGAVREASLQKHPREWTGSVPVAHKPRKEEMTANDYCGTQTD